MNCLKPIVLKSGLVVPCGKCDLCRSDNRNEWSIRLAINLMFYERMPMFITLTYDNDHVPMMDDDGIWYRRHWKSWKAYNCENRNIYPSLIRDDVSTFMKRYKRKYGLDNDVFTYFGCGEYGDKGRPHYHLLFFGDNELYDLFFKDSDQANKRIFDIWKMGFVYVGVAGFDGIHYVTKYVLKDGISDIPDPCNLPFTIASKNLGMRYAKTYAGRRIKERLEYLQAHRDQIYEDCPRFSLDDRQSLLDAFEYLSRFCPDFSVILDDGRKVFLPRAIRRKLIGSFQHFKDNPMWLYIFIQQLLESNEYYAQFGDYDLAHELPASYQALLSRVEKINKRLLEKHYNNKFKEL